MKNRALIIDFLLYAGSAIFAALTIGSNLASHRPWGAFAAVGYATAAVAVLLTRGKGRLPITLATWGAVCLLPLLFEAVQRAAGHSGRAQEEVLVVENSGVRMLETGTPFLGRSEIAALPDPLLGYTPYQPGMAVFGIPRGLLGAHWLTDARIWFALATIIVLYLSARVAADRGRVLAIQAVTVLPVAALTLATGGDDLPVLALTLLGLSLLAQGRDTVAGVAIGIAAALKLFAWPVALVFLIARPRQWLPVAGIPILTALPALIIDPHAFAENVVKFPLGHGLVKSPAASPLPGHLIAENVSRELALGLLLLAGLCIAAWIWKRRPSTAADVALISAVGLFTAMMLMPATRFGYLLYPAAYALWIPYLKALAGSGNETGLPPRLRESSPAGS
ncbi:glycosyltransferase 87 family protein [Longispora albida]|uniref:glycosyltransferase 87 family protein n=1 Tax=Longispora albida TaxID=203523 RepID=UPI0003634B7F|nr:glycosyltransferase 87 family protein [Longispora albida]